MVSQYSRWKIYRTALVGWWSCMNFLFDGYRSYYVYARGSIPSDDISFLMDLLSCLLIAAGVDYIDDSQIFSLFNGHRTFSMQTMTSAPSTKPTVLPTLAASIASVLGVFAIAESLSFTTEDEAQPPSWSERFSLNGTGNLVSMSSIADRYILASFRHPFVSDKVYESLTSE